jgi:hypothetical protein
MSIRTYKKGIALIEALIYIGIVSLLMSGFVQFAYAVHFQDIRLMDEIHDAENQ